MRTLLLLAAIASGSPAASQTGKPLPIIENLAALAVASRWCKEYSVDIESPLLMAIKQNINPTKPPYKEGFDASKEKFEGLMADIGVSRWCSVTYDRFRPGGAVPGFMMKR